MGRSVVKVPRHDPLAGRRRDTIRSLTASGILPTYDTLYGSPSGLFFNDLVVSERYAEVDYGSWPCEAAYADVGELLFRDGDGSVHRFKDGTVALVHLGHGSARITAAGTSRPAVLTALAAFQELYPPTYLTIKDDGVVRVPITFWTNSQYGPQRRLRMIESQSWEEIAGNYPGEVHDELASLMEDFVPGSTGQLLLWQGPPGTGKTWALRALASHWRSWAEFNYITDPDAFFVDEPIYLLDVLLSDSYEAIDEPTGDLVTTNDGNDKWRVLILEDTGELLSAHAKEKYGQGLSRLLNVVDGMIGQGLRVLCLVTTNDELGDLNPAVLRPGRCASQLVFRPFTRDEAEAVSGTEWEQDTVSLAEIYAARGTAADALAEEPDTLTAAADADPLPEIARVAEQHVPEGGTYGDTWWRADDRQVFWNAADWSGVEEVEAAEQDFLAIDGVDSFDWDAEVGDMSGEGYTQVWPEPSGDATAAAVALARSPLNLAPVPRVADATVTAAVSAVAAAHDRTVESITSLAKLARS